MMRMTKWSYFGKDKMKLKQGTDFIEEEFVRQCTLCRREIGKSWLTTFRILGFAKYLQQYLCPVRNFHWFFNLNFQAETMSQHEFQSVS